MDGVGNDQSLAADMPSIPDLQVLGVEPQVRELTLQRTVAKRVHTLVELQASAIRDAANGQPRLVGYVVPQESQEESPATGDGATPEFWPSVGPYQVYDEFLYDLMSSETERLARYRAAFESSVQGRIVLDIGTGEHALLARMAVEAGARRVYAVEVLDEAYRKE